jgi:hypothetical protein
LLFAAVLLGAIVGVAIVALGLETWANTGWTMEVGMAVVRDGNC